MVDIGLMQAQEKYFQQHREEILGRKDVRFAMIHSNKVEYFFNKDFLYHFYPHLTPGASPSFGNHPMLVDIGKETNSIKYRREQLEEKEEKLYKSLKNIVNEFEEINKEKEELKIIN